MYCSMLPFEVVILYLPIWVLALNHIIKHANLGPTLESTVKFEPVRGHLSYFSDTIDFFVLHIFIFRYAYIT